MPRARSSNSRAARLLPAKENKDEVVRFRVSVVQKKSWAAALVGQGVEDHSSFYRGAIEAAIVMTERAADPAWQKFLHDIQAAAKKRFGARGVMQSAVGYEFAGRGIGSALAAEVFKSKK
jgi:hypothetical protein